jgi:hypothetical protein
MSSLMKDDVMGKLLALLFLSGLLCCCSPTTYVHDVPNLAIVRPGFWRSGQPTTTEQWQYLYSLGIREVVKLNFESEGSDLEAARVGMVVHYLGIQPSGDQDIWDNIAHTFVRPDSERLRAAQEVLNTSRAVLVHCTHGQDRTGLVIGRYRVLSQGWTKEHAYHEMLDNHFHPLLHGLHEEWEEFGETGDK